MSISVSDCAVTVENRIFNMLSRNTGSPFKLPGALLYGVSLKDDLDFTFLSSSPDAYALLDSSANRLLGRLFDAVVVITTGWVTPFNADGSIPDCDPSEHPLKRRVRLSIVSDIKETVSLIRFSDDPDEVVVDEGSGIGLLPSALRKFLVS